MIRHSNSTLWLLAWAVAAGAWSAEHSGQAAEPTRPVLVTTWPVARGLELICVLDQRGQSLCLYRYGVPGGLAAVPGSTNKLELVAVRSVKFDLLLEDLNGAAPTPTQVRDRLREQGRLTAEEEVRPVSRPMEATGPVPPMMPTVPRLEGRPFSSVEPSLSLTVLRVSDELSVLCVLDPVRAAMCLYEFDPKRRRLRLVAARSLQYDFALEELNIDGLSPKEVEDAIKKSRTIR